ncbi:hypothetical protein [Paracidobacterium acidisoli]|uniref:Uncharacterized protein n=1 Tax=Paracidobacterium acidisoli TaxID=2303751 RepID=A0A372IVB4_9BACT|nr:hypothetical protein [Paracidobacterium acidisoli]MBT9329788.1 hypothetical protein [Paracidobacterium acidisoli]
MRSTIRNFVLAPAVLAAMAFTATSAMASSALNVPFSFTANGRVCPPGRYILDAGPLRNSVVVTDPTGKVDFSWVLGPGDPSPDSSKVAMQFDRDGDGGYQLRSVQYGAMITGRLDKKNKHGEKYAPARVVEGE